MSLISDFKANFLADNNSQDFIITEYQKPNSDIFISFYGIFDNQFNKINAVATKPLENSQFTTDSKQIKPYVISVTGMFFPDDLAALTMTTYQELADYMAEEIETCNKYADGIMLFTLDNLFSFGKYEPLTLLGVSQRTTSESPIPEVTLLFSQAQSSTAVEYNTVKATPYTAEPQNLPSK